MYSQFWTTLQPLGCFTPAVLKIDIAGFHASLELWRISQQRKALHIFRNLAGHAYEYIVLETPQYSGTTVGNWRFNVGSVDSGWDKVPKAKNAYSKASTGSPNNERTMLALLEGHQGRDQIRSLADKVFISNSTEFVDGGSVADMETSPGWLRSANQPGMMITRALSWLNSIPVTSLKGYGV